MSTTIAKKEEYNLATMSDDFGDWKTGDTADFVEYPFLKVLSDPTKQGDNFADKDELGNKHLGKLFIKSRLGNMSTDLTDSFVGTLVKMQQGVIFRKDGKIAHSYNHPIAKSNYPEILKNLGIEIEIDTESGRYNTVNAQDKIQAVTRLMVLPDSPIELSNGQRYPFFIAEISGSSWGNWIKNQTTMKNLALSTFQGSKYSDWKNVPPTFWRLAISSVQETTNNGYKIFPLHIDVALNKYETALSIAKNLKSEPENETSGRSVFDAISDFDLIFMSGSEKKEVKEDVQDTQAIDEIDINDLPF